MPEIKHTFTGGKMNKDLDERLVPNGEYTDAMNIQVSTSEGSDVGTVQNILGNIKIGNTSVDSAVDGGVVVCSIADEKNDKLYYFVWTLSTDYIFEYSRGENSPIPVLVDKNKDVLKFREDIIVTGVNIIDDMLFWTDNNTEPKKINITRCKEGTPNITTHTKLINESQGLTNIDIEEKHVTVIKKAPRKPLDMLVRSSRDPQKIYTGVFSVASAAAKEYADSNGLPNPSSFRGTQGNTTSRIDFSNITTEDGSNTFNISITRGVGVNGNVSNIGWINHADGLTGWHVDPAPYPSGEYDQNVPTSSGGGYYGTLNYTNIKLGTKVAIKAFDEDGSLPGLPVTDYVIKGVIEDYYPAGGPSASANTGQFTVKVKALAIDGFPSIPEGNNETLDYIIDLWDEEEKLFEFKFPRFSYRYKYEDGEYSPFAPFTQVAFLPGSFDYHPRKGYNLGMTNRAFEIELNRMVTAATPKDVVEIDILFKDEPSPSVYVVDTLRPDEYASLGSLNKWDSIIGDWENGINPGSYLITKETIQNVVPSNQLLRPWDNVPRKALAQSVTGSRVVYGNYLQNYNLKTQNQKDYTPSFANLTIGSKEVANADAHFSVDSLGKVTLVPSNSGTAKSIKSLREYQLGVVFSDEYGRETPVVSNNSAVLKLEKEEAAKANSIKVMLNDYQSRPAGLTHLKFFIKETSGEYYNMAMDRFYDAEDGNVWLAFPSSDRNKIDIDTFIILKKGSDQDTLVSASARYKVIAIENQAPNFIKTSRLLAASETHIPGSIANDMFDTLSGVDGKIPVIGVKDFKMAYAPFKSGPGRNLDKIDIDETLYIEFSSAATGQLSDRYKITSIAHNDVEAVTGTTSSTPTTYSIQLDTTLKDDVNFITNDLTGANSNSINTGTIVNIYKYKVENKPQFDGRFFVKIYEDETFSSNIGESFTEGLEYRLLSSKKVYSMKGGDDHISLHWTQTQKMLTDGVGINANDLNSLNAHDYWYDGQNNPNIDKLNFGYYLVDEFASMATYFRKMRKKASNGNRVSYSSGLFSGLRSSVPGGKDIIHLAKTNSPTGAVEYPTGVFHNDQDDWEKEYGTVAHKGHTARWEADDDNSVEYSIEKKFMGADKPMETDVWFIDGGPAVARSSAASPDNLSWLWLGGFGSLWYQADNASPGGWSGAIADTGSFAETGAENRETSPGGFTDQNGLTTNTNNTWNMLLSYGGITGSDPLPSSASTLDFFNFAGFNDTPITNSYYTSNNSSNTTFVKSITPGEKFRWREDPTNDGDGTVYSVSANISLRNLLRHSGRVNDIVSRSFVPNISLGGFNIANQSGTFYGEWPNTWSGGAVSMAEDLSFNFSAGFNISNITPALAWDPTFPGQIPGGLEITLVATASGTSSGQTVSEDLSVYVNGITGTSNYGTATLHVGMALYKYTTTGSTEQTLQHANNLGSSSQEFLVVREILKDTPSAGIFELKLGGYSGPLKAVDHDLASSASPSDGSDLKFVQVGMNGYSDNSEFNINKLGRNAVNIGAIGAVGYTLDFVDYIEPEAILSENPAIWETEPKEIKDLDIYYEASPSVPLTINASNVHDAIPTGSIIEQDVVSPSIYFLVVGHNDLGQIIIANGSDPNNIFGSVFYSNLPVATQIRVNRPDGLIFKTTIETIGILYLPGQGSGDPVYGKITLAPELYGKEFIIPYHNCYSFGNGVESNRIRDNFNLPFITNGVRVSTTLEGEYKEERRKYGLIYSGIYNSTGGVNNLNQFVQAEKITKDINPIYGSIQKLHSRDTDLVTLCEDKCLRILANKDAVFNADGNTNLTATQNVLGQTMPFSGEYGISTNPESFASESYRAYFTDRVRGTVMRLSKDGLTPISSHGMKDWFKDNLKLNNTAFGSYDNKKEEYNLTLSDRVASRVQVIGYQKGPGAPWTAAKVFDTSSIGIVNTYNIGDPIQAYGIPTGTTVVNKQNLGGSLWRFTLSNFIDQSLLGSFYAYSTTSLMLTVGPPTNVAWNMVLSGNSSFNDTISFKENTKGWVSFKSFLPENALSMANDYYTFKNGNLWRHHAEQSLVDRNTFYNPNDWVDGNNYASSSVEVVLNDSPSSIKDFHTLNYEGSQSKVQKFINTVDGTLSLPYQPTTTYTDQSYYNLSDKLGWYVDNIYTDKEEGYVNEFLEKEGKWYNNINRTIDTSLEKADTADFTFQGIGTVQIAGCTNPAASNYNPNATVDDGNCILQVVDPVLDDVVIAGCTDVDAVNYNPLATTDDGSCSYLADDSSSDDSGDDSGSGNDGDVDTQVYGCTDPTAVNFNPLATVDDGSCTYKRDIPGCTDPSANNYNPLATIDNGSCRYGEIDDDKKLYGCTDPAALNYSALATHDNGSCMYREDGEGGMGVKGCTNPKAINYNPLATLDDGSCVYRTNGGNGNEDVLNIEKGVKTPKAKEGVKTTKTKAATKPATTQTLLAKEVATPTRIPTRRRGY